jgi:hypothetical protein
LATCFLDLKTDQTLLVDMSKLPIEALKGGAGMVRMTLRQKKGRIARVEVTANENVAFLLDGKRQNVVKRTAATK